MADTKISALPSATTPLAGTEVLPIVQGGATDKVSVADLTAGRTVEMLGGTLKTTVDVAGATTSYVLGACPSVPTGGAVLKSVRTTTPGANHEVVIGNVRSGVMNDNFKVDENGNIVALLGNFQVNTAAKGVNFTANTPLAGMTSQLLNWYEEGTWTPSLTRGAGFSYTAGAQDKGFYTRIGNQVTVQCSFNGTFSGGSGAYRVTGLPFASKVVVYASPTGVIIDQSSGLTIGQVFVESGASSVYIWNGNPVSGDITCFSINYLV